jgi:hypothetical protein
MNSKFIKEVARVFLFAFLGAFLPLLQGIFVAPDWNAQKAALVAALVAAVSAGVKVVVDLLTKGVAPAPGVGVLPPSVKN